MPFQSILKLKIRLDIGYKFGQEKFDKLYTSHNSGKFGRKEVNGIPKVVLFLIKKSTKGQGMN